jgi:hypothetical protein
MLLFGPVQNFLDLYKNTKRPQKTTIFDQSGISNGEPLTSKKLSKADLRAVRKRMAIKRTSENRKIMIAISISVVFSITALILLLIF